MKWTKNANEGTVVADGNNRSRWSQLSSLRDVDVDHFGQIYVANARNNRVMRRRDDDAEESIMVDGNRCAEQINTMISQFYHLIEKVIFMLLILEKVECNNL